MVKDDNYIIRQCLDGKPNEFRQMVRRYQNGVAVFLSARLKDKYLVEEAVQETFIRAYFRLSSLKNPEVVASCSPPH